MDLSRRALLSGAIGVGASSIAGCLGGDGSGNGEDCPTLPQEPAYGGWFEDTSNYDRTCDFREQDAVSVTVGAQGNLGYYAFGPPAVAVTTGTTVEWEWNGRGGSHDVQENNDRFDSGRPVDSEDETFEVTFEDPGVFRYFCSPHRSHGMKGAVFVGLE